jgi:hypothetical protein
MPSAVTVSVSARLWETVKKLNNTDKTSRSIQLLASLTAMGMDFIGGSSSWFKRFSQAFIYKRIQHVKYYNVAIIVLT